MILSNELKAKLDNYCRLLEQEMVRKYPDCIYNHYKYTYTLGQRFIRIVQCNHKGEQVSVWCFCDYEGNLYKASGWKAPAKDVRGHIDHPILDLGGFYKRG